MIYWLKHAGFLLRNDLNIYIDPFHIREGLPKADIVLITHSHYDHCSIEDLKRIVDHNTIIIAPPDCQSNLARIKIKEVIPVEPFQKLRIRDIEIETIPAYNVDKPFHPKDNGWVGYIIKVDGKTIYHAGDTDLIREMESLRNKIDLALLPVSGVYVMNPREAFRAFQLINPKKVFPMHYGEIVGGEKEKNEFIELVGIENIESIERIS